MLTNIAQTHIDRQIIGYKIVGRLGDEYLSTMSCTHDSGCTVYIQADVAFGEQQRFAGVYPHANTYHDILGPGVSEEKALSQDSS